MMGGQQLVGQWLRCVLVVEERRHEHGLQDLVPVAGQGRLHGQLLLGDNGFDQALQHGGHGAAGVRGHPALLDGRQGLDHDIVWQVPDLTRIRQVDTRSVRRSRLKRADDVRARFC